MNKKLTVVISQGQSANPIKRKLEEDLVAALLFERGVEVTVIPHLYDLPPDGTGMLCLQGITGDMVLLSWLYPRAAHWILDRNAIGGRVGKILLVSEDDDEDDEDELDDEMVADDKPRVIDSRPAPDRTIYCLDLRAANSVEPFLTEIRRIAAETSVQTVNVDLMSWIQGSPKPEQLQRYLNPLNKVASPFGSSHAEGSSAGASLHSAPATGTSPQPLVPSPESLLPGPHRIAEPTARRWYPVIDYSRCTNCLECLDFCLFGVYGISGAETILVEQPDNCRKGCPACSRVCPENAIIFPQHKSPAIAGSPNGEAGGLKIDLSKLFGAPDALQVAVLERDVELVAAGKEAVGMAVGIPKRQTGELPREKDELDNLMDSLDELAL
ncbi:MAG TPA: ferredoxin family protein [Pirellulales bacterium]|nr:ferredoxin family protein [Pirellulales bacterium]